VRSTRAVLVLALWLPAVAGSAQPASERAASDQALSQQVEGFLQAWLVNRDPQGAVRSRSSVVFSDERFVPGARSTRPSKMGEAQFGSSLGDFVESMTDMTEKPRAESVSQGLPALLLPFSMQNARDADPQLASRLAPRKTRTLTVAGVPSLAYPVRSWDDIAWTASATVGYRSALKDFLAQNKVEMQAVVSRLRQETPNDPPSLVVTLWSDEATKGKTWRLVGVEIPATR
jgi:hypothetical protein